MRRLDAIYLALCVATIAFAVAFVWPSFHPQEVAWYYPVEHRWAYEVKPSGLAIDFYGRTILAIVVACGGFGLAYPICRKLPAPSPRVLNVVVAWTASAVVFAMLFYGWTLHFRVPSPSPIPSWYQPR